MGAQGPRRARCGKQVIAGRPRHHSLRRPMTSLPFLMRLIAATILARQNKALMAEVAYLRSEIAYLHEQLPAGHRFVFTDIWRLRFARHGAAVGWKRLAEIATVAKAKTIQGWERLRQAGTLGKPRAGRGRPRIQSAIEQVIRRLAQENPVWGQKRIAGILAMLLLAVSPRTIAAVLKRDGLKPAPERSTDWTWKRFVTEKADAIAATDFFTVDTWEMCWRGLVKRSYDVLFAIHHRTRQVEIMGVTEHSDAAYMVQTARNATMDDVGWLKRLGCRYVIHDGDGKFCPAWQEILRQAGIETKKIPPRSPNCNAIAERWVSTVKRECIRRCWFLDYAGLCRVLREFTDHYNTERPHQSLDNRPLAKNTGPHAATQKIIAGFKPSQIRCVTRCNGTVRHYYRVAA
jgi:transposase InsO family protein